MSWAKEPSAGETKVIQLNASAVCPANFSYRAAFRMYRRQRLLPPIDISAASVDGKVSFSVRYKKPATMETYDISFVLYVEDLRENEYCQYSGSSAIDTYEECELDDSFTVKRADDRLGRVLDQLGSDGERPARSIQVVKSHRERVS
jgi:hypothetical protein